MDKQVQFLYANNMHLVSFKYITCLICVLFTSFPSWAEATRTINPSTLKAHVDALSTRKGQVIAGNFILGAKFLQKFYKHNQYRRVWTNAKNITALRQAIHDSWEDGLQRKDFHARALGIGDGSSPASQTKLTNVQRDILLSDAFVHLLYQLFYGKVDPERLDPNWNIQHALPSGDPVDIISNALTNNKVGALIDKARVKHPYYQNMQEVLKIYTYSATRGTWPTVPTKLVLRPGQSHKSIPLFRKRLAIYDGKSTKAISQSELYDKDLAQLVRIFQKNHGLDADGVLGPLTTKELNIPAQKRVDQIRVNMERARWAIRTLSKEEDLILVNIAGFYLHVFLNNKRVWTTDVITGKPYFKTPVFTDKMEYIVLNPTWGVPRSIMRNEIFPKAKADPSYLTRHNYMIVSGDGRQISPTSLDWSSLTGRSFPYNIVQKTGPRNALGRVKFIFPNRHNVYLHDTPSRSLFSKTGRAFSHGCIRVHNPLKLAEIILRNRNGMTRKKINQIVAGKKLRHVNLKKKLPVAILYWTVDTSPEGEIRFFKDIYGRDTRLLKALNQTFRISHQ